MKKTLILLFCALMMLTSCSAGSRKQKHEAPKLTLVTTSNYELQANVVRDQLTKAGFDITLKIMPDLGSKFGVIESRNYDLVFVSWSNNTAAPDYAVRPLFFSTGADNDSVVNDPEVDKLIDEAAAETADKYGPIYDELEELLVTGKTYIVPLHAIQTCWACNKDILNPDTVKVTTASQRWNRIEFNDPSKSETEFLIGWGRSRNISSMDPLKGNHGGTPTLLANSYVRLLNLSDDDDKIVTDDSLSYNYAIGEGNKEFYFILRDDIFFSKAVDKKAVDTGVRVGAEDVVFSVSRAADKDAVPGHMVHHLFSKIINAEIITDIAALRNNKESGTGKSIYDALNNGLKNPVKELMLDKAAVDNANGKYQVVKLTTDSPFPQILNMLAHHCAGIVCKEQVEKINTFTVQSYDRSTDIAYGDEVTFAEGPNYNNTLYCSGPYTLLYKNDYEVVFERNPGFMKNTPENQAKIKNVKLRLIPDLDAACSALRSGEIHMAQPPENQIDLINKDPHLVAKLRVANRGAYWTFNLDKDHITSDINIRKAILYAINQDEMIAVLNGKAERLYSTLQTLNNGRVLNQDLEKSKEYLDNYFAGK